MNNPEYVEVNGRQYKINTDFHYAIECDRIAKDDSIGDVERALAVIYTLFGEEGLNHQEDYEKLLKMAKKYLSCGKEIEDTTGESDMDFIQDYNLIWTSMYSDYNGLDIDKQEIHWWKFMDMMNGLSNSEMGNCCILNRIRNLRNFDVSQIKDSKEREKIMKAQKGVELKSKREHHTQKQKESVSALLQQLGIREE